MFSIPSIPFVSGVDLPSLFGGSMTIPGVAAFVAAVLIAALVGSALGLLREATSPHGDTAAADPTVVSPSVIHDDRSVHREAA